MKRFLIAVACLAFLLFNTGGASESSPVDLAKYFSPGSLVFATTGDLAKLLPAIQSHKLTKLYIGSPADDKFRDSKLYMKLAERFEQSEKLSGIGISYDNLFEVAGSESALALYDIGELKMVFLTAVSEKQVLQSTFGKMMNKFEQRRKGDRTYYVVGDETGAAFAFAIIDGMLLVSNDLKRFEQSLGLLSGEKVESLADSAQFKAAIPAGLKPGDLTLVLDQESLNDNLYFRTYWIHRNANDLKWIKSETLNLTISEGFVEEQRWFTIDPAAPGAPSQAGTAELAKWPSNTLWLDIMSGSDSVEAAANIVRWATGDVAQGADVLQIEIAKLIEAARPEAIAKLARANVSGAGFWLDEQRLVAIKLASPNALNVNELKRVIADRWSGRIGVGGLAKAAFVSKDGVESISMPLMGAVAPSIMIRGALLIVANDPAIIREYVSAPNAPGYYDVSYNTYMRIDMPKARTYLGDAYNILSKRSNWQSSDSETFFMEDAPALLNVTAALKTVQLNGRREGNVYFEQARYELAK